MAKADYGIDAPGIVRAFLLVGLGTAGAASSLNALLAMPWAAIVGVPLALVALYALGMGAFMVFESKVGKLRTRERLLDRIVWRGDEAVLDIGCTAG